MKIYTKTGDAGDTGLFGGGRVQKDDARVEAYGDVDELNAVLGMARAIEPMPRVDEILVPMQRDLFSIGALLATPDPLGRMRELYEHRDPLYREIADIVMDTGAQSVQSLARALLQKLEETWKASA